MNKQEDSIYRQARLARDPRFDGQFFVAVKTTGIFCRPVCPVQAPKERNVQYFHTAQEALKAGFRPCLRCRPDSAPGSYAWLGSETTLRRAIKLMDEGALLDGSVPELAERLGISERYLRKLFNQHLGIPPSGYAQLGQLMFAKKLLHESDIAIQDIALASGFNSVRSFNTAFKKHLQLTPSAVRKNTHDKAGQQASALQLSLSYRPPLNWQYLLAFYQARAIEGMEWVEQQRYGRSIQWQDKQGWFTIEPSRFPNKLSVTICLENHHSLQPLVNNIRRQFDLDADVQTIETHLTNYLPLKTPLVGGLRLPGIWSPFEAGIRAIIGQQVSVAAARTHLSILVDSLGKRLKKTAYLKNTENQKPPLAPDKLVCFPTPRAIVRSTLPMLRMPQSRKQTLRDFAALFAREAEPSWQQIQAIKGIGPWTLNYLKMRGLNHTDIWLEGDLGIQKAIVHLSDKLDQQQLRPWRSYACLHLWSTL